jgi:hypothetical protein
MQTAPRWNALSQRVDEKRISVAYYWVPEAPGLLSCAFGEADDSLLAEGARIKQLQKQRSGTCGATFWQRVEDSRFHRRHSAPEQWKKPPQKSSNV